MFALEQVFHCVVEAVERPDVEGCEGACEREDDEEDERAGVVGRDGEGSDGVDDAEEEVRNCEEANVNHCFAEGGFDDAVAHADDEEEEEGEGVAAGVEDGDNDEEDFSDGIGAMVILVIVEAPGHELFDD